MQPRIIASDHTAHSVPLAPKTTIQTRLAPPNRRSLLQLPCILAAQPLLFDVISKSADARPPSKTAGDWSSPGLAAPEDEAAPKFYKTDSGVKYQEVAVGTGLEAKVGDRVLVDYVLRRANGYFIISTVEGVSFQPKDIPVGPVALVLGSGEVVPGLVDGIVGMKVGGKRRMLIPPELGYTSNYQPQMPTFATKRQVETHKLEPLLFEVELLRVSDKK